MKGKNHNARIAIIRSIILKSLKWLSISI